MPDFDPSVTPSGGDNSATPAPATSGAFASPVATPQATPAPATPGAAQEDRSNWIPPYRLREASDRYRQAEQTWQQRESQMQTELQRYQEQIRRLVGVEQPSQASEADVIRQQFGGIFPGLSKLEQRAADIEKLIERAADLEAQVDHYWTSFGRQTMNRLFERTSETLGTPLTDAGKKHLHGMFVSWVGGDPQLAERYANDPSVIDDFLKDFTSNFVDPVRRNVSAGVASRAAAVQGLPQDVPGGVPHTTPPPAPRNLDERMQLGWNLYQQEAQKRNL